MISDFSLLIRMDLRADMSESGGMRVLPIAALSAWIILLAAPSQAGETIAVARVEAGLTEAGLAAAGPKPFVDIVCPIMQQQAEARGLPPMPFVRLIWRESRFNPQAVSPKGAQGIAQFMPGTASDRGLDDPFEPKSAIVHSASLLADLRQEFGNFGLAAAAYNAGEERVRGWLAGKGGLPGETEAYVFFVTGRAAEEWKLAETELPEALKGGGDQVQDSCRKLAPLVVRAVYETEPLTASGAWRPWGVHVSTAFSKAKALAQFGRLRGQYASVLADREPFVLPERNLSRGRRYLYMVQIGADSREDAAKLCGQLRSIGGACIVQKN
ncbi:MAG TPA: lytic transglycosylase [Rhizobiales bacterium]|nr:lytic transglycosylase [Hyphomicrobiales bacterium]HAN64213.1 lytic transglycosylase [Hyphomicrobiales bacterium]HCL61402.1 lytic transglycosylase [Hyphomicrobiales bacterium]